MKIIQVDYIYIPPYIYVLLTYILLDINTALRR